MLRLIASWEQESIGTLQNLQVVEMNLGRDEEEEERKKAGDGWRKIICLFYTA